MLCLSFSSRTTIHSAGSDLNSFEWPSPNKHSEQQHPSILELSHLMRFFFENRINRENPYVRSTPIKTRDIPRAEPTPITCSSIGLHHDDSWRHNLTQNPPQLQKFKSTLDWQFLYCFKDEGREWFLSSPTVLVKRTTNTKFYDGGSTVTVVVGNETFHHLQMYLLSEPCYSQQLQRQIGDLWRWLS